MAKKRIYATNAAAIEAIDKLRQYFDVEVWDDIKAPSKEVIIEKSKQFDGMMIESNCLFDQEVFQSTKTLKVIGTRAVGYDNIDLNAATKNGIAVGNTPGILHESCADFTFGLILA